ncbi:MAG TPA: translation initiation factor IF-3 [Spirochaetia bacterium]|nr:translation initiation factor IF-3 [Spirochaetia bacterium]
MKSKFIPRPVDTHRYNYTIKSPQVMVIDEKGQKLGVLQTSQAVETALSRGFDLVEVASSTEPPVCKIMDFGKFKFEQQKKKKEAKKKQVVVHLKEIQMRPHIDSHDYNFKMDHIRNFIEKGDKVKITIKFRGRELSHKEIGANLLEKALGELGDKIIIESAPKMEGRILQAVIAPNKK